ncbi:MAG: hypothetical protein WCL02_09305 [bacterium]
MELTVDVCDIPCVAFAQVGNTLKADTKLRTTVVKIFVFVFDATLISKYKE